MTTRKPTINKKPFKIQDNHQQAQKKNLKITEISILRLNTTTHHEKLHVGNLTTPIPSIIPKQKRHGALINPPTSNL